LPDPTGESSPFAVKRVGAGQLFFFDDFFFPDFFFGALPPPLRASDKPMAIACFLLVTFFPDPLFSVPSLRSCIAFLTFFCAFFPYLAIDHLVFRLIDQRTELVWGSELVRVQAPAWVCRLAMDSGTEPVWQSVSATRETRKALGRAPASQKYAATVLGRRRKEEAPTLLQKLDSSLS